MYDSQTRPMPSAIRFCTSLRNPATNSTTFGLDSIFSRLLSYVRTLSMREMAKG